MRRRPYNPNTNSMVWLRCSRNSGVKTWRPMDNIFTMNVMVRPLGGRLSAHAVGKMPSSMSTSPNLLGSTFARRFVTTMLHQGAYSAPLAKCALADTFCRSSLASATGPPTNQFTRVRPYPRVSASSAVFYSCNSCDSWLFSCSAEIPVFSAISAFPILANEFGRKAHSFAVGPAGSFFCPQSFCHLFR